MKQARKIRSWLLLKNYLLECDFEQSSSDGRMFFCQEKHKYTMITVAVDGNKLVANCANFFYNFRTKLL